MKNIVITGGGTGGHTSAALAFSEIIYSMDCKNNLYYIGSSHGLEKELVQKYSYIKYYEISTGKFRRSLSFENFLDFFRFIKGIFQAKKLLKELAPVFVLSTGGYVCLPTVIAAGMLNIPVFAHEQTSVSGLANRIAFRYAEKVLLSFDTGDIKDNRIVTGNPVRKEFIESFNRYSKENPVGSREKPVLFITGGANGSFCINKEIMENIDWILENFKVFHQYGNHKKNIQAFEEKIKAIDHPDYTSGRFFDADTIAYIYSMRPVLVGRSGAGTITDIINFNIVSILVPLKNSAGKEQLRNAEFLARDKAAFIIEEDNLSHKTLKQALINSSVQYKKISNVLKNYKRCDVTLIKDIFSKYI